MLSTLGPAHLGVGCRYVAEATALGVLNLLQHLLTTGDWCILLVDVTNAFNTLGREYILRGAARMCPSAFNYLRFAYAAETPLFHQGSIIRSQTGTQQG